MGGVPQQGMAINPGQMVQGNMNPVGGMIQQQQQPIQQQQMGGAMIGGNQQMNQGWVNAGDQQQQQQQPQQVQQIYIQNQANKPPGQQNYQFNNYQ
jgi:hypothetical protein